MAPLPHAVALADVAPPAVQIGLLVLLVVGGLAYLLWKLPRPDDGDSGDAGPDAG